MISHLMGIYLLLSVGLAFLMLWQSRDATMGTLDLVLAAVIGLLWPLWLALFVVFSLGVLLALVVQSGR